MRVAFVIARRPWYQLFAPIIEAALAQKWDVECWHDYSQPRDGLKGYQFPLMEALPEFAAGRPVVRSYAHRAELATWLADGRLDAVVSIRTPQLPLPSETNSVRPVAVELQHSIDTMVGQTPQSLLTCDVVAMYSPWWLAWAEAHYARYQLVPDVRAYDAELSLRTSFVGLPAVDAARAINASEVRRQWNIPEGQPVVVLLPFPQGVGQAGFWPRRIYGEPSRLRQLAHIVAQRRFEYLPHVWHGWNDRRVIRAIRAFCDRSGAYLLVKSRMKTPIPDYLTSVADRCVYDESAYPATILQALSVASLSIGHYSSAVLESVALGVPHLCIPFGADDYFKDKEIERRSGFTEFFTSDEGGAFQFRGVSTVMPAAELLATLPERRLGDFAIDPSARSRYVRQFLHHDERNGGTRLLQAIERAAAARTAATSGANA